ncbi:MAG: hypothetical protein ABSH00_04390 [Bryobacteraceae bacterium]
MPENDLPTPSERGLSPEVLPPVKTVRIGPWAVTHSSVRVVLKTASAIALLGMAGWFFQNFLQLRGVVDLRASRIDLAFLGGSLLAAGWILTSGLTHKVIVRALIVPLLVAGLWGLDAWAPKPAVVVEPNRISFDGSIPQEMLQFIVRNETDSFTYEVQLKLKLSKGSWFDDSTHNIPVGSFRPIIEGSTLSDVRGLRCVDRKQQPTMVIWIYRMEPHGIREINVIHKQSSHAAIEAAISYFTRTPAPRMGDPTQATGTYHFDEPLSCDGHFAVESTPPPMQIHPWRLRAQILPEILTDIAKLDATIPVNTDLYVCRLELSAPQTGCTGTVTVQDGQPKPVVYMDGTPIQPGQIIKPIEAPYIQACRMFANGIKIKGKSLCLGKSNGINIEISGSWKSR